jgi:hypothetical protein
MHKKIVFGALNDDSNFGLFQISKSNDDATHSMSSAAHNKHELEVIPLTPFSMFATIRQVQEEEDERQRQEGGLGVLAISCHMLFTIFCSGYETQGASPSKVARAAGGCRDSSRACESRSQTELATNVWA